MIKTTVKVIDDVNRPVYVDVLICVESLNRIKGRTLAKIIEEQMGEVWSVERKEDMAETFDTTGSTASYSKAGYIVRGSQFIVEVENRG